MAQHETTAFPLRPMVFRRAQRVESQVEYLLTDFGEQNSYLPFVRANDFSDTPCPPVSDVYATVRQFCIPLIPHFLPI